MESSLSHSNEPLQLKEEFAKYKNTFSLHKQFFEHFELTKSEAALNLTKQI